MKRRLFAILVLGAASAGALPDSEHSRLVLTNRAIEEAPLLPASAEEVERELAALDRDERAIKRELEELAKNTEGMRARTITRGRAYVRMARAGLLPVAGGMNALVAHASKLERLRRGVERDLSAEKALFQRRIALGKTLDSLRLRRGPLEVQVQAMSVARTALLADRDRKLAFERAFQTSDDHLAIYGAGPGPSEIRESGLGLAAMKGRLNFPLPGRFEVHASHRIDGPGLELKAPRGTEVRAVYPGRIAFADLYADYGKTVIVDHGDQHYTVSANLDEVSVRVGDDVGTGTRLGSVGDAGQGGLLYFEIRVGSENVDPAPWFGL